MQVLPWHTQQTIEALLKNTEAKDSDLIIYSDAAKDDSGQQAVDDVRAYLKTISGFRSIRVVEQEKNMGLAKSIISGVTEVVEEYGRVIVLEDDMVTSPYFLEYMNDGLNLYADEEKVISIHAYSFPIDDLPETFFIKGASCWGWATWQRGWELFEEDGAALYERLQELKLMDRFNLYGAYPYKQMLLDQIEGKNNSWAVRWYASALLADKLSLHSGKSLLMNIGLDGSGSHCGTYDGFNSDLSKVPINVQMDCIMEDENALVMWQSYLRSLKKTSIQKVLSKFRCWMGRLAK